MNVECVPIRFIKCIHLKLESRILITYKKNFQFFKTLLNVFEVIMHTH